MKPLKKVKHKISSATVKTISWIVYRLLTVLLNAGTLKYLIRYFAPTLKKFRVKLIFNECDSRLGHLTYNTFRYTYLNRKNLYPEIPIFIFSSRIANRFYADMLTRGYFVFYLEQPQYNEVKKAAQKHEIFREIYDNEIFSLELLNQEERCNYVTEMLFHSPIRSYFSAEDQKAGAEFLKSIGADNTTWHFCFMARDCSFLYKPGTTNPYDYHNFRDSDINTCIKGVEYITEQGGTALRMGSVVEKPIATSNPRIIDYATRHRQEFADIFLTATSKFVLASAGGYADLAYGAFGVPTIFMNTYYSNVQFWNLPYYFTKDNIDLNIDGTDVWDILCRKLLNYPMRFFSKELNRDLTLTEIYEHNLHNVYATKDYTAAGVTLIPMTEDEILDAIKEMNDRIDNKYIVDEDERRLRKKACLISLKYNQRLNTYHVLSGSFLKKYSHIIN